MTLVGACAVHVCALFVLAFVVSVVFAVNAVFALIIPWPITETHFLSVVQII